MQLQCARSRHKGRGLFRLVRPSGEEHPPAGRNQRPKYHGFDPDSAAETEADHLGNCPVCGALLDMRDLDQVLALAHVHDAEIEISEGPEPPPLQGVQ
jgi:hypothetical protein